MASIEKLKEAKKKLSATNLTNGMPGRKDQFDRLYVFLQERLKIRNVSKKTTKDSRGINSHLNKTVFICGVPGTGKTATVHAVLHRLEDECSKNPKTYHPFEQVHVNGQQIRSAQKIFSVILLQLTGENKNPNKAQEELDKWVKNEKSDNRSKSKITDSYKIIIIDELDILFNERSQTVFYNLFDWPTSLSSKIILIAIANALDHEKFMRGRIRSRLGMENIVFSSYSTKDLESILECRLGKSLLTQCFEATAIKIITTRIGKMTGDARRTLETCRNALEIAIRLKESKVTAKIVNEVGFQSLDSLKVEFISDCHPVALIFLKSLLKEIEQFGEENVDVDDIINEFNHKVSILLDKEHPIRKFVTPLGLREAYRWLEYLASADIICFERNKPPLFAKVYLKETTDAFKDLIKKQEIV